MQCSWLKLKNDKKYLLLVALYLLLYTFIGIITNREA